jgi:hypothetical protein
MNFTLVATMLNWERPMRRAYDSYGGVDAQVQAQSRVLLFVTLTSGAAFLGLLGWLLAL